MNASVSGAIAQTTPRSASFTTIGKEKQWVTTWVLVLNSFQRMQISVTYIFWNYEIVMPR